ncbi:MAG: nuclear transport factor 2 family protein [Methanobacterium sp.]|uniref:nuclear transport factor 2 family protein n=1 Tax=Methanobacterium sp. TaxID=2164 RepID=UPI003D651B88|nr:nuclear transport factor 2 family protein [Methanobacterium sp.]
MKEKLMKRITDQYIKSFNEFDVEGMLKNIHRDVVFKNIAGEEVTVELNGKIAFKNQIDQPVELFEKREMKIIEQKFGDDMVENHVDFKGVLAVDIPDGPKKHDLIRLQYTTIFKFKEGKIISIEDIN